MKSIETKEHRVEGWLGTGEWVTTTVHTEQWDPVNNAWNQSDDQKTEFIKYK